MDRQAGGQCVGADVRGMARVVDRARDPGRDVRAGASERRRWAPGPRRAARRAIYSRDGRGIASGVERGRGEERRRLEGSDDTVSIYEAKTTPET